MLVLLLPTTGFGPATRGFVMEHEMLPKLPPHFSRVIEAQLESEGGVIFPPEHVAKLIRYQVEDMVKHMKIKYLDLYGVELPIDVAWMTGDTNEETVSSGAAASRVMAGREAWDEDMGPSEL